MIDIKAMDYEPNMEEMSTYINNPFLRIYAGTWRIPEPEAYVAHTIYYELRRVWS